MLRQDDRRQGPLGVGGDLGRVSTEPSVTVIRIFRCPLFRAPLIISLYHYLDLFNLAKCLKHPYDAVPQRGIRKGGCDQHITQTITSKSLQSDPFSGSPFQAMAILIRVEKRSVRLEAVFHERAFVAKGSAEPPKSSHICPTNLGRPGVSHGRFAKQHPERLWVRPDNFSFLFSRHPSARRRSEAQAV